MKNHVIQSLLLLLVCALMGNAAAQSVSTAELHVLVKDPVGAMVSHATVSVRDDSRNFRRTLAEGVSGEYTFLQLPPGEYVVTVEAQGFARVVAHGVRVTIGQQAELPVTLKVAGTAEEVLVSANTELVETQRTSTSTTVGQTRIDNLPINGRNYIQFTLTNSQVTRDVAPSIGVAPTSGLNFGGQRARNNLVNVDGVDHVDNSTNGIRSTVGQEMVQEFQIITNGYAPEYGRASGGVVNIITRSGTNDFHGNAFGFLRHKSFQADNPFSNVENPAFTRVLAGATLGGPIKKDRTFFFGSFETTRRRETGFSTIGSNNFGLIDFNSSSINCQFLVGGIPTPQFPCPFGTVQLTPEQAGFLTATGPNPDPNFRIAASQYLTLAAISSSQATTGLWPAAITAFQTGGLLTTASGSPLPGGCNTLVGCQYPGDYVALNGLTGNYPISETTSIYGLRLDHKLTDDQDLMLRVNVTPSTVTGIQVNAQNQNFGQNAFSRTSEQDFHDLSTEAQHVWAIGGNKVNELRFQFARRGLLYTFSSQGDTAFDTGTNPDGGQVAVNIPGFAFFGREPFSFANRTEKRYQVTDNFSWVKGNHTMKFGADVNYIPVEADFTVNFGGLFNFGTRSLFPAPFPAFSPVQMYGVGIPEVFIQQVGDPHYDEAITALGFFWQDSWALRRNFTVNYGVRYDVELTPEEAALNALSQAAQDALGITQGIPQDNNNVAPRIGFAWDPFSNGKTVVRASYGLFYDHPLIGVGFLSQVADGTQAPGLAFFGASPSGGCSLTATNVFQGILACPPSFGYLPDEMRLDDSAATIFLNQNFLGAGVPLSFLPFGFPIGSNFEYSYSHQASFGVEHEFPGDLALSLTYNYNGARHLNRSQNVNPVDSEALVVNWERAVATAQALGIPTTSPAFPTDPRFVGSDPATFGTLPPCGVGPLGPYISAPLMNFFRTSGANPSLEPLFAACAPIQALIEQEFGLGLGVPVPFSDMSANLANGSSVYHGLTVNLRKRFTGHYEFLASYTWSHTIDDSTDLQSLLAPQDNRFPQLERSESNFDQRHRFVLSAVLQSGTVAGDGFWSKLASDWTFAPIVEIGSGRPFNILVGSDRNFDFGSNTDRPLAVAAGTGPNLCGDAAVASEFSPTGFLQPACFNDGVIDGVASALLIGDLQRNAGIRPTTIFADLRVSRTIPITERVRLEGIMDVFNIPNRFNVADVNFLYTLAGQPTSSFDPRQFQFALKLHW